MQLQVDLQIAEYELNKAKEKLKTVNYNKDEDENDDEESTNSSTDQNGNKSCIKRKKSQGAFSRAENYNEKKARFETTIESFNNYLKDPKEKSKNRNKDNSKKSGSSENEGIEELIKNGEMTPFGTLIDFEKGKTLDKTIKESSSSKVSKASEKNSSKSSNQTDFDSFFLDLDKQLIKSAKNRPKTSNSLVSQKLSFKSDSNQKTVTIKSDFLNKDKESKKNETPALPNVSNSLKKELNKKHLSSTYVESSLTEFDKFLIDLDKPKTSKQAEQETTNKKDLTKEFKTKNDSKNIKQNFKAIPKISSKEKETNKSKNLYVFF